MNEDGVSLYSDAQRYDLVMGTFASGDQLDFYRRELRGDPEIETRAMAASTIAILRATRPYVIFDRIYFS